MNTDTDTAQSVDAIHNQKTRAMAWDGATSDASYDALTGQELISSDDIVVGTVAAVYHPPEEEGMAPGAHYLLVEPSHLTGPGGAGSLYVPETAIAEVGPAGVRVPWTRDEIENQGWASKPALIDEYRRA